jgi:hypothetical protein
MESRSQRPPLEVSGFDTVMEGADMRALVLTLAAGECVPWHYHSEIPDRFFCLMAAAASDCVKSLPRGSCARPATINAITVAPDAMRRPTACDGASRKRQGSC